jgi:multidrug transporter EmrE-like cation transporter
VIVALLLLANMTANTAAHIFLKRSAAGGGVKRFLFWQVLGNLVGFVGVLAYVFLLKGMPLHTAYPLTEGLSAIGVQIVGGLLVLREKIRPLAWAGTGLVLAGIVMFSL